MTYFANVTNTNTTTLPCWSAGDIAGSWPASTLIPTLLSPVMETHMYPAASRDVLWGEETDGSLTSAPRLVGGQTDKTKTKKLALVDVLMKLSQWDLTGVQMHCSPPPQLMRLGSQSERGWRMVHLDLKALLLAGLGGRETHIWVQIPKKKKNRT